MYMVVTSRFWDVKYIISNTFAYTIGIPSQSLYTHDWFIDSQFILCLLLLLTHMGHSFTYRRDFKKKKLDIFKYDKKMFPPYFNKLSWHIFQDFGEKMFFLENIHV